MSDLDTEIDGSASTIRSVATWLRSDLEVGLSHLGDTVATQRSSAQGDWDGEAATAFSGRASTLATSADDGARISGAVAGDVDLLATALETAQREMGEVRTSARAGDLVVDGFWVRNPGSGPAADDPAAEAGADKVTVWNQCVEDANAAWTTWQAALDTAGSAWSRHDTQYVGIAAQLLSSGIQLELIRRTTPILTAEVDSMLTRAAELRAHADALRTPDGHVSHPSRFYDLLDEADRLDAAHPGARGNLPAWELPRGLTRGLWVLDVAAAGYGVHSDWDGEGPAQAITSNVVPAAASIASGVAAGAATGAVVGSFIPVPGVGTAAGVVVGAGVGLVVGAFTSGAIDSLFDSGADTLGDWGDAVADGAGEIADTVSGLAEGAGGVFDAIF